VPCCSLEKAFVTADGEVDTHRESAKRPDHESPAHDITAMILLRDQADRAAQVVRNLLTFARKHPRGQNLVSINSVIESVLKLRVYEQKVNNIKVITRFSTELPEVVADSFQLQQVFFNLIINAEYFMIEAHHGGTVTITTGKIGGAVRVKVMDDGPGISEENLKHLFNPFFTTKPVGSGTGLGLSICYGIISEHNGRIYCESTLGEGTTFTVELPVGITE
jgi:signal transduction histidine kinase